MPSRIEAPSFVNRLPANVLLKGTASAVPPPDFSRATLAAEVRHSYTLSKPQHCSAIYTGSSGVAAINSRVYGS